MNIEHGATKPGTQNNGNADLCAIAGLVRLRPKPRESAPQAPTLRLCAFASLIRIVRFAFLLIAIPLVSCRPASDERTMPAPVEKPAPGEELLETASIDGEEVQTLRAERRVAPAPLGPCSWSSAWQKDDVPNPHLAGVGGLPMPVKTSHTDIMVPGARPETPSEIHAEILIGPFGAVLEATIVHASEPRWPEAEQAILDAVRQWRYEPQTLDGKPVTVCSTLVMKP